MQADILVDNLLNNACHYAYPDTLLRITAARQGGCVQLCFCNAGADIPPEKLARMFERFFRLDTARSSREQVYAWLAAHAHEYGFILRYPADKTEHTGFAYEPWHYRYVGRQAAAEIHAQGLCLEEYLAQQ